MYVHDFTWNQIHANYRDALSYRAAYREADSQVFWACASAAAVILADRRCPRSPWRRSSRLCWQMPAPPQSLDSFLRVLCSHFLRPLLGMLTCSRFPSSSLSPLFPALLLPPASATRCCPCPYLPVHSPSPS
jgi:hypothetical protein